MDTSNIIPTKVDHAGLTSLITRLGKDCHPTQFLREFTRNSIEAVMRARLTKTPNDNFMPTVIVEPNWEQFDRDGIHRICFTDNGDGMTPDQMIQHLNSLSSSGHENEFENYGVGAKISAFTRNKEGILYESWVDGVGSAMVIHYDEDAHAYGIMRHKVGDEYKEIIPLPEDKKPDIIDQHGTRVTLYGNSETECTMSPPEGALGGQDEWLRQYMTTRFFRLPSEISLKVRARWHTDRFEDSKHNALYPIHGQKAALDSFARASGTVKLKDVSVHWWILKPDRKAHGRVYIAGHTGCIHEDELFDIVDSRGNRAQHFGITMGKANVVIYVEAATGYRQNTARTGLTTNSGGSLPWERWQEEFRNQFPQELQDYVQEEIGALSNESHADSIEKRLKDIMPLFKITRFKASENGSKRADPDSIVEVTTGESGESGQRRGGKRGGNGLGPGSTAAQMLADLVEGGIAAEPASPSPLPDFYWVSRDDNGYSDDLDDRAATYNSAQNVITANASFAGFTDLIAHFMETYSHIEGAEEIIKNAVHDQFQQQLTEVVMGALSLKNRQKWNREQWEAAVSPEALTTACMCRYHQQLFISRTLKNKLQHNRPQGAAE